MFYRGPKNDNLSFVAINKTGILEVATASNVATSDSPAAVVWKNQVWIFFRHGDQLKYNNNFSIGNLSGWSGATDVADYKLSNAPAVVVSEPDRLYVFWQFSLGSLYYCTIDGPSQISKTSTVPGVQISASPAPLIYKNSPYVFHQGSYNSEELWYTHLVGNTWAPDKRIDGKGPYSSPTVTIWGNNPFCYFENDGRIYGTASSDGIDWTSPTRVPGLRVSAGSSPCVAISPWNP